MIYPLRKCALSQSQRRILQKRANLRFYATSADAEPLVKPCAFSRSDWERRRIQEEATCADSRVDSDGWQSLMRSQRGFGRPHTHKSKIGTSFIARLQNVNNNTPESELRNLLVEISLHIDELNELLRTMFIYQDVTYRVWVYEIAQIVGLKHRHMLMRDVQLVIDDLSLFYDAAAQGALTKFEGVLIKRANELEINRLPLVIHALGRCGYNTVDVARVVHEMYLAKRGHPDFYKCHLIGLLLKGYAQFHFHPGMHFMDDAWMHIRDSVSTAEFKYLSWLSESFLRMRLVDHAPLVLDELLKKHELLSHLEYTDFISGCWSIQTHILSREFAKYLVPGSMWQLDALSPDELTRVSNPNTLRTLYRYYHMLLRAVMCNMGTKIYGSTPPYRATQFELLTRLLVIYPNPRDFRDILPLRKFDAVYPKIEIPGNRHVPKLGTLEFIFQDYSPLRASRFFGEGHDLESALSSTLSEVADVDFMEIDLKHNSPWVDATTSNGPNEDTIHGFASCGTNKVDPDEVSPVGSEDQPLLTPLPAILKTYLHSIFFRTPALAPRGIRILLQGLVRIHFELREDCIVEPDLLPHVKTKHYNRPLSHAIVREVYRKLACYNTDDLLITLYCMLQLRMLHLELAPTMLQQLTGMWAHQLEDGLLNCAQREHVRVFYETLLHNEPEVYTGLRGQALDTILQYCPLPNITA
eukprot:XP_001609973.1 hypothetical protein [Babesia bovis T2Bo]